MRNYLLQTFFLNIYISANIFSIVIFLQTIFLHSFSVFFLFVLNVAIALLNYFSKNPINSATAFIFCRYTLNSRFPQVARDFQKVSRNFLKSCQKNARKNKIFLWSDGKICNCTKKE